jgi:hypothetical protein
MIYEVLQTLTDNLNVYFRTKLKIQEDKAELSAIVNQDGTIALQSENKVLVTLLNIEREPFSANSGNIGRQKLSLNIIVIFSCHFSNSNYSEAIRFLDLIITYFEENYTLEVNNIYDGTNKIKVEIETFNLEKVQNIWSTIGAKYLPSVIYKLRMIVVDSKTISTFTPAVQGLVPNTNDPYLNNPSSSGPVNSARPQSNNNLDEIDKALELSGLSTDTTSLKDQNTRANLNNMNDLNNLK